MEETRFALGRAAATEGVKFVLRPVDMARASLLIPDEQVEKPREFLDRVAQESNYEPPNVSLRAVWSHLRAAWRGETPDRSTSL